MEFYHQLMLSFYAKMGKKLSQIYPLVLIVIINVMIKFVLLAANVIPFNSDEAVVGLMARHILHGERPVFFYGQAYMGSLDAYFAALLYALTGPSIWGIRIVQIILYSGVVVLVYFIALELFHSRSAAIWAALLTAIPPVNSVLYTTASLGGYNEALLLGCVLMFLGIKIVHWQENENYSNPTVMMFIWSIVAGLGLWANALTLVFAVPVGLLILFRWLKQWQRWSVLQRIGLPNLLFAGFILGSLPWWLFAVNHGFLALTGELLGGAVAVEKQSWLIRVVNHLVNLILLGATAMFGFRPPWEVRWLAVPLIPFVGFIWGWVLIRVRQQSKENKNDRRAFGLTLGVAVILSLCFVFTSFGVDPSGRYFLPVYLVLSIAAGRILSLIKRPPVAAAIGGLLLVFHIWGTATCAFINPPGITTQFYEPARVDHSKIDKLIEFLHDQKETTGYTNYWVAYPLAFLSNESLIFVPRLPYHPDFRYTARDDRYQPYQTVVAESSKAAYITTRNPELAQRLRNAFLENKIAWKETVIGEYQVFYQLSRKITPEELDLGLVK